MAHLFSLDLLFYLDRCGSLRISKKLTIVKPYFQRSWKDVSFPPSFPFAHFLAASHITSLSGLQVSACQIQ